VVAAEPQVARWNDCVACGLCVAACPADALVLVDRASGHPLDG
jgi:NAD-dependent dihydropyrimidine dehydrogenase PreA subunit